MPSINALKRLGILTSPESWFWPYANDLADYLRWMGYEVTLYRHHQHISQPLDVLFILSYFHKIPASVLEAIPYPLVVHESDLPAGKGWAPLFWQILEGKNRIPVALFHATEMLDAGPIYLKDHITLSGYELHDEIRRLQAKKTMELCIRFLREHATLIPQPQQGASSTYPRRTPADSELNIDKTIREQFNLLRIVDNENYPAFFIIDKHKYIIKILHEPPSEE